MSHENHSYRHSADGLPGQVPGYDRDEVNRFLEELALTVENANRENSQLREKLAATEQQVTDLRRTERDAVQYTGVGPDAG